MSLALATDVIYLYGLQVGMVILLYVISVAAVFQENGD
jgi:hypothetical protein